MSDLTKEQLETLRTQTNGFVGTDWKTKSEIGNYYAHDPEQQALVVCDRSDNMVADFGHHDCGTDLATAVAAIHNAFPALLDMALECLELREYRTSDGVMMLRLQITELTKQRDDLQATLNCKTCGGLGLVSRECDSPLLHSLATCETCTPLRDQLRKE
jgi:hypothetical protein